MKIKIFSIIFFCISALFIAIITIAEVYAQASHAVDGPVCAEKEYRECDAWCTEPGAWCNATSWTSDCPAPGTWFDINNSQTPVECCSDSDCAGGDECVGEPNAGKCVVECNASVPCGQTAMINGQLYWCRDMDRNGFWEWQKILLCAANNLCQLYQCNTEQGICNVDDSNFFWDSTQNTCPYSINQNRGTFNRADRIYYIGDQANLSLTTNFPDRITRIRHHRSYSGSCTVAPWCGGLLDRWISDFSSDWTRISSLLYRWNDNLGNTTHTITEADCHSTGGYPAGDYSDYRYVGKVLSSTDSFSIVCSDPPAVECCSDSDCAFCYECVGDPGVCEFDFCKSHICGYCVAPGATCVDDNTNSAACICAVPVTPCVGDWCMGGSEWIDGACCGNDAGEIPRQSFYCSCSVGDSLAGTTCTDTDGSSCGFPGCTYTCGGCPDGGDELCCADGQCADCNFCAGDDGSAPAAWECYGSRCDNGDWKIKNCSSGFNYVDHSCVVACECSAGDDCCTDGCNYDAADTACGGENCGQCDSTGTCSIDIPDVANYNMPGDCIYNNMIIDRPNTNINISAGASMTLSGITKITIKTFDIAAGTGDAIFINSGTELILQN